MRKIIILLTLVALAGCNKYGASSQSSTQSPIPKSTAESALTGAGYQNPVLGPSSKYPGGWMGTASKGGQTVPVTVDATGKIVQ